MTAATLTITDFLLARIDEDQEVAQAAVIPAHTGAHKPHPELPRWRYEDGGEVEVDYDEQGPYPDVIRVTSDSEGLSPAIWEPAHGTHIARHDPARVLAECEARRQIVTSCAPVAGNNWGDMEVGELYELADTVLASLAAIYSDHPDYDESWRP